MIIIIFFNILLLEKPLERT